ncbi:uncharacterized protein LOC122233034 isoform X2 [Panthera tigris]|uniref:uncharacterized protein LOC122233034 isoform X2 n=1 Tax=Panthera tigris TaxID=9694 RepID=UPI001C6F62A1|nr:uncharacterized protein LOC122233034 isoform X2 [Panthera tigris]
MEPKPRPSWPRPPGGVLPRTVPHLGLLLAANCAVVPNAGLALPAGRATQDFLLKRKKERRGQCQQRLTASLSFSSVQKTNPGSPKLQLEWPNPGCEQRQESVIESVRPQPAVRPWANHLTSLGLSCSIDPGSALVCSSLQRKDQ